MTTQRPGLIAGIALLALTTTAAAQTNAERGAQLARELLLADTHIDVPYRLNEHWEDVTRLTAKGEFDYPRARAGGLDLPFMSIYTPAEDEAAGTNFQLANQLIDSVEAMAARAPDRFQLVSNPMDALKAKQAGRIALAMGMENGSPLQGELKNVQYFRDRGISYITLAHSLANQLSDSSYDKNRPHGGLSEFGRAAVAEMNRVGVMVDVSHASDDAFWQVLEISRVPVIATHSSARHFTPGFERNMSDEMIKALAARGGLIMINFGSSFVTKAANEWFLTVAAEREVWLEQTGHDKEGPEAKQWVKEYRERIPLPFATTADVADHVMHVIEVAGVDHVGLGSDFDGVGDSLPDGLKDVSAYPNLVAELLKRGVDEAGIAKILGKNLMRVWGQVVAMAEEQGRDS
jgi:membrane dipeptidase